AEHAAERRRVVLLAESPEALDEATEALPSLRALGLVVLSEGLRPDAVAAVGFLRDQGGAGEVILGGGGPPAPAAARAPGVGRADRAVAGLDLPTDQAELEEVAGRAAVFGRITPEQKRDLIASLARRGRYVAMVGDGVNDVLALKEARLAIAMGNGS